MPICVILVTVLQNELFYECDGELWMCFVQMYSTFLTYQKSVVCKRKYVVELQILLFQIEHRMPM